MLKKKINYYKNQPKKNFYENDKNKHFKIKKIKKLIYKINNLTII